MNRSEILDAAKWAVTIDRAATHGDAEDSFSRIAAYWSTHLGHPVSAVDVSVMMGLMKAARIKANPGHVDSWTDACGYFACGGEIATKKQADVDRYIIKGWIREPQPVPGQYEAGSMSPAYQAELAAKARGE